TLMLSRARAAAPVMSDSRIAFIRERRRDIARVRGRRQPEPRRRTIFPMTPPPSPYTPDRTHRATDLMLPPLAGVGAVALCLFLWVPAVQELPRSPAFFGGGLVGLLVPRLVRSRYRVLGLVVHSTSLAALIVLVAGPTDGWPAWLVGIFALLEGL